MKTTFTIFIALAFSLLFGQSSPNLFDFTEKPNIKVIENGDSLSNAWAGGINNAVVNTIDLNLDGTQDLVIFDKSSKRISTFLANPTGSGAVYKYAPEYRSHFPAVTSWMLTRDYNCDGKKDIFYNKPEGRSQVFVLKNTSSSSLSFTDPVGGPLQVSLSNGQTTMFCMELDMPAIEDIDEDGDLDFFSFSSGGSVAQFNENLTKCGLDFRLTESCWGHFAESGIYRSVQLSACPPYKKSGSPYKKGGMHSGSSMLLLDLNDDGLKDLLLGNVTYEDITALYNTGSVDSTHFTSQDTLFPQYDKPIEVEDFVALFYEDVNLDGVSDLLASPRLEDDSEDKSSLHLYTNYGTESNPVFNFTQSDFIQEGMIDLGTGAVPRLVDLNSDTRPDLVVSNYDRHNSTGSPKHFYHYYKNTGSVQSPEFTLVDSNFADIPGYNLGRGTIPAFGDLNDDGIQDMIIGDENGQLHYFTNSDPLSPAFTLHTAGIGGIDVGQKAAPFLFDMDRDGDLDLVIGNQAGNLHYYENSSATSPNFSLKSNFFGAVNTHTDLSPSGLSIPYVFEKDSLINLFVGSTGGGIFQFDSISNVLQLPDYQLSTIDDGNLVSSGFEETPFGTSKQNGRNQFLIRASELRAAGLSYGYITKIAFDITTSGNSTMYQGISIRCKLTTDSVLTGFQTGLTEVRNDALSSTVGFGKGWTTLHFTQQPFLWDGKSNLVVDICYGGHSPSSDIKVAMTDVGYDAHAIGDFVNNSLQRDLGCKQAYKRSIQKRPNTRITLTPALAHTDTYFQGTGNTAPAFADINLDGFMDMIVGNKAGGLNYFEGKVYEVSLPETPGTAEENLMEIFPNPGTGDFNVLVPHHGQAQLRVFDLTGKMILNKDITERKSHVSISGQPSGIYLFVLSDGNRMSTQKVLLQ